MAQQWHGVREDSIQEKILNWTYDQDRAVSTAEIAEIVYGKDDAVLRNRACSLLQKLEEKGLVEKCGRGVWEVILEPGTSEIALLEKRIEGLESEMQDLKATLRTLIGLSQKSR